MATQITKSLKGRRMRITRLDECGEPVIGACSSVVTGGFIKVDFTPNKESGEEFIQKNAWGDLCIDEKDPDVTKWWDIVITACELDPGVMDIVGGASLVTSGADTIGVTFGPDGNTAAFAIEVWTKQAGAACSGGSPTWGYFIAPFVTNGNVDGTLSIANATMSMDLVGQAQTATADWGVGPYGDNPFLAVAGFPTGEFLGIVKTTVQPPAATVGCVALAA